MAFKKIEKENEGLDFGTFVEWAEGVYAEGFLVQVKHDIKTKFGEADIATIQTEEGEHKSFIVKPSMKFNGFDETQLMYKYIRVTASGEKKCKSGRMAMQYEVEVDDEKELDELPF